MPDLAASPGTYFPNAPLKEAAFQVRFNPLLKIERDIAHFQEGITEEYPLLGKDKVPADREELPSFVFHTPDKTKTVRASIGSFGLSTTNYHHFDPFRDELLKKTETFCKCYDISAFTRVGLRYINNIEIPERDGVFDFTEFVHPQLNLERISPKEIQRMAYEVILTKSAGFLAIRSGFLPMPPVSGRRENKAVYVLDLDYYTEAIAHSDGLRALVETFHNEIEKEFLSQVTKYMVAVMRGGA